MLINGTFLNSNLLRLFKLLCFLFLFAHWNGCIQFFVASFDTVLDPVTAERTLHPSTWVMRAQIIADSEGLQWSWSFYHAMVQLFAVSDGLVSPRRPVEAWLYLISMVLGAALCALLLDRASEPSVVHRALPTCASHRWQAPEQAPLCAPSPRGLSRTPELVWCRCADTPSSSPR